MMAPRSSTQLDCGPLPGGVRVLPWLPVRITRHPSLLFHINAGISATIPMTSGVESLNAATAAAVMVFEAARQMALRQPAL